MTKLIITTAVIVVALWILNRSNRWRREHARLRDLRRAPGEGTDADVERLVRAGRKMSAIKLYREIHRVDLKTAKEAVDEMMSR